jgi:hypothetical protein
LKQWGKYAVTCSSVTEKCSFEMLSLMKTDSPALGPRWQSSFPIRHSDSDRARPHLLRPSGSSVPLDCFFFLSGFTSCLLPWTAALSSYSLSSIMTATTSLVWWASWVHNLSAFSADSLLSGWSSSKSRTWSFLGSFKITEGEEC